LRDGQPILIEAQPVDAAGSKPCERGDRRERCPAVRQGQDVEEDKALDSLHAGQPGDRGEQRRVIARAGAERSAEDPRRQGEVRRVGAGEEAGERRLRPPGPRHRAHRHAAQHPDEHDDREIAAPSPAERGAEAIPADARHKPGHGTHRPPTTRRSCPSPTQSAPPWSQQPRGTARVTAGALPPLRQRVMGDGRQEARAVCRSSTAPHC